MPTNFLSLPYELREIIYKQVLIEEQLIDPNCLLERGQVLTTGLLRVNKAIHLEASQIFYTKNRFDFESFSYFESFNYYLLLYFVDLLGKHNRNLIRHIRIPMPAIPADCLWLYYRAKGGGTIDTFDIFQRFVNVRTVTIAKPDCRIPRLMYEYHNRYFESFSIQAFKEIHCRIKTISSSLKDINIEMCKYRIAEPTRKAIEELGWRFVKEPCNVCDQ